MTFVNKVQNERPSLVFSRKESNILGKGLLKYPRTPLCEFRNLKIVAGIIKTLKNIFFFCRIQSFDVR